MTDKKTIDTNTKVQIGLLGSFLVFAFSAGFWASDTSASLDNAITAIERNTEAVDRHAAEIANESKIVAVLQANVASLRLSVSELKLVVADIQKRIDGR